jgi:subfamily B ATP-binding cassette protein MsbA
VATIARGGSLYLQVLLTNRFVTRIEADMQAALHARLIDADVAQLREETTAALTQRFTTDFAYIKEALTRVFTVLLRDVAMLVALVAVLFYLDWVTTLVAAAIAPFVVPPIARIGRRLRQLSRQTQEEIGAMAGAVSESLAATQVAKTYQMEEYLKARGRAAFEEIRRLRMKAAVARARMDPILEVGAGLAIALVIVFVGWRIRSGATTLGDFASYSTALLLAAQPVRTLGNLNAIVQEALAALARTHAVMDRRPTITDQTGAPPLRVSAGEVAFRAVSFSYGSEPALTGIDAVAAGGRRTALVGRSGAGKSTLLSLVPRLFDPTAGAVLIDGQDLRTVSLASLRRQVAVVSQEVLLFDDSIRANIAFGRPDADQQAIEAAARAAAAHDFIRQLPEGYDTRVGERGSRLSGGERQRVALARAFLKDAPILLLDEATSALDPQSELLVQEALARLMQGRTTIVIAHRLATVRDADQILVMEAGRIVEAGTHASLSAAGGAYARLNSGDLAG